MGVATVAAAPDSARAAPPSELLTMRVANAAMASRAKLVRAK
jgi:hypothetical protein